MGSGGPAGDWGDGPAACQIAVPNERAGVSVAFDAVPSHQDYAVPSWFAKVVPAIGGERHYPSLQREILLLLHQAARASAASDGSSA